MSETATKVTKTAVGVWSQKPEERGEWVQFSVDVGSKYPLRLATKLPALIEKARALRDETATWTYTEAEGDKINPNSGKPYVNRFLEKVEAGGTLPASGNSSSAQGSSKQMSKEDWAKKDSAGDLRACIAIAVSALSHTMPSEPSDEDLGKFLRRVGTLSESFHRQVQIERSGEEAPFD